MISGKYSILVDVFGQEDFSRCYFSNSEMHKHTLAFLVLFAENCIIWWVSTYQDIQDRYWELDWNEAETEAKVLTKNKRTRPLFWNNWTSRGTKKMVAPGLNLTSVFHLYVTQLSDVGCNRWPLTSQVTICINAEWATYIKHVDSKICIAWSSSLQPVWVGGQRHKQKENQFTDHWTEQRNRGSCEFSINLHHIRP